MPCELRGLSHQIKSISTARFIAFALAQRDRQATVTSLAGIWCLAMASLLAALGAGVLAWSKLGVQI
jgi:hypothetical protein